MKIMRFDKRLWFWLVLLIWTFVIYCTLRAANFSKGTDMATVLFGAASLALFVFSMFIAVLAVFGWQTVLTAVRESAQKTATESLGDSVKTAVDASLKVLKAEEIEPMKAARLKLADDLNETKERLANELRGRASTILGYVIGQSALDPATMKPKEDIQHKEDLEEAIHLCEQGYAFLKKVGGPAEYMGLNNLVFYAGVRGGGQEYLKALVQQARELLKVGSEKRSRTLLLTACRTLLEHGTLPDEKFKSWAMLKELVSEGKLSGRETREANIYLEWFKDWRGPLVNSALPWENTDGQGI